MKKIIRTFFSIIQLNYEPEKKDNLRIYIFLLILGLIPRIFLLFSRGLEFGLDYDEIQTVTHSFLPVNQLFESIKLIDPSPPIYYFHLHYWLLIGTSDLWIKLNSVFWGTASILSLFYVSSKIYNIRIGLLASILFVLSPYPIFYSTNVRMYSFMMFFGIWCFFFTWKFLNKISLINGVIIFFTELIILFSHGAGFIYLISIVCFGYLMMLFRMTNGQRIRYYTLIQFFILILYSAIWLPRAFNIYLGYLIIPNLRDIIETLTIMFYGMWMDIDNWGLITTMLIIVFIIHKSVNQKELLIQFLSFLVIPVVSGVIISNFIRPIWTFKLFSFTSPFLSIMLSLSFSSSRKGININEEDRRVNLIFLGIFLFGTFSGLALQQKNYIRWWPLKQPVKYVQKRLEDEDLIFVSSERLFWGWMWYFVGPGSFNTLDNNPIYYNDNGIPIIRDSSLSRNYQEKENLWIISRHIDSVDYPKLLGKNIENYSVDELDFSFIKVQKINNLKLTR